MWRRIFAKTSCLGLKLSQTLTLDHPLKPSTLNPSHQFSTSILINKIPKKLKKKRKKKESPRTKLVRSKLIPTFERIVEHDARYRFLTKTKEFLSKQPEHVLRLDDAGKLNRELGFPRGRKVNGFIERHPLIFQTYRHSDNKMWLGFTDIMEDLIEEEQAIINSLETDRVTKVCKLLMMSKDHRIPLNKIYHCRLLFGIPDDFRDRVVKYPDYFKIVVDSDRRRVLELMNWDPLLAVSALEKEFAVDEEKAKKACKFSLKHGKDLDLDLDLDLDEDDTRKLNLLSTLPLVSPYSDGSKLDMCTLEAEKYRMGLLHEFLSLTLEKRAYLHHIVEFKEEFGLTKHKMLLKQPRTFYLSGTQMNWVVFLKNAYSVMGDLIEKDPQVIFNEKLYRYAEMQASEARSLQV